MLPPHINIQEEPFGQLPDGQTVFLYTLVNSSGQTLKVTNYGAIIVALTAADQEGRYSNIVLGYKDINQYQQDSSYLGAIIGRYAGRIAHGRFNIDGENFQLSINSGEHHIHGGVHGLHHKLWQVTATKCPPLTRLAVGLAINVTT